MWNQKKNKYIDTENRLVVTRWGIGGMCGGGQKEQWSRKASK